MNVDMNNLASEWQLLQQQCDDFEKYSVLIKLANVFIVVAALVFSSHIELMLILVLSLWLLDGIWKTFQSRTEQRLLAIEKAFAQQPTSLTPFQFNQSFISNRPSGSQLIIEYCRQALRPTVAIIHVILVMVMITAMWFV